MKLASICGKVENTVVRKKREQEQTEKLCGLGFWNKQKNYVAWDFGTNRKFSSSVACSPLQVFHVAVMF